MTRGPDLEERCLTALGFSFAWKQAPDDKSAWRETRKDIDAGFPVLLQTDLHYLKYYNTKTHFNRHAVLLWGYDEEKGVGYLSDTEREGLIEVSLDSLAFARCSAYPPGPVQFDWFPIGHKDNLGDLKNSALEAIRLNAQELASVPADFPLKMGLRALESLAADLENWKDAKDWSWSARFAYQAIEKRGTGGSAFRKMYAEFLDEMEALTPEIKPLQLANLMKDIAAAWSEFAYCLKEISEQDEPNGFDKAARIAGKLYELEKEYCIKSGQLTVDSGQ